MNKNGSFPWLGDRPRDHLDQFGAIILIGLLLTLLGLSVVYVAQ